MPRDRQRGGRDARRATRTHSKRDMLPALARNIPLYEVLSAAQMDRLHDAAIKILATTGIEFRDAEALELWRNAGANVDGERVRVDEGRLMELVGKAPAQFTMHARNPARSVEIGGNHTIFAPTYGSPFVRGFDGERRYGTVADLNDLHKLAYLSPALHNTGAVIVEPVDVSVPKRHLHITYSALKHSDKAFMGPVTAPERAADAVKMAGIVFGDEFVAQNAVMMNIVNCNTPLVWDDTMLGALKVYSRSHQPCIVSPFTLAGANTPASAMATVGQLLAEALAGIAFTQIVRPGAPVIMGNFLATVSMRSGAPMAGTSELALMNLAIGQFARRYGVPWRSSGMLTGSKITDAQAGYESAFNMLPILLAGCNVVMHSAGWTEAGLTASFAKFMADAEQVDMLYKFGQGPQFDDLDEALAGIDEVGPGGHFLGSAHTQAHFQNAFFTSDLADNNSFEQWQLDGNKTHEMRAFEAGRKALANYEAPALDPAIDDALLDYIKEREAVLPDGLE